MSNQKLIQARAQRHWTQEQTAVKVGIGVSTYRRWEAGTHLPHASSLALLCETFHMPAEDLGFPAELYLKKDKVILPTKREAERAEARETDEQTPLNSQNLSTFAHEPLTAFATLLKPGESIMFDPTKRKTLETLLATITMAMVRPQEFPQAESLFRHTLTDPELWERLKASEDKPSNIDAGTLEHFETLTSTCWKLSNAGQLQVAEQVLPGFLPNLLEAAPYHPKAASIVAQGLRLQSILVAHRLKLADKVTLCEQAIVYARQSNDYDVLVTSLIELVVAFRYTQQYENALRTSQEALYYSRYASPLLLSRAYIVAAETFSRCGLIRGAELYTQLAYETFPDCSEYDPLVHANPSILTMGLYEGLAYLNQGNGIKALTTFGGKLFGGRLTAYQSVQTLPERIRLEITNYQGRAAILSNNLEEYVRCLGEGLAGAILLKSQKRFDEALTIFSQDVPPMWRNERQIKDIAERFHLVA